MKLALVHDWLNTLGGAERVLIELHKTFPQAPIYVLFYDKRFVRQWLPDAAVHASFLQKIPFITRIYPMLALLMPIAIESFDLSHFDRVISSSVTFSKGLVLKPSTKHICYCYSPARFLWDRHAEYINGREYPWLTRISQHLLRLWDYSAADRADHFVAISEAVKDRIGKYYRKEATVIYPPATLTARPEKIVPHQDFYLIVSRLYDYKNIRLAIETFNKLGYPLVIIGDGPDRRALEREAKKNIVFLGARDDATLASYYNACRAFIMPQEEDFGLTPVEAMQFGKPVVALRKGGALETVVEGRTGEFFDDAIPEAMADAIGRLNARYTSYYPTEIKEHAKQFSAERFKAAIMQVLQ